MAGRAWTLEAARAMLGDVRSRTERAVRECEALAQRPPADRDARSRAVILRWAREMEALGVDVKGLWRVDFDNGSGCYCWQWPEEEVAHFHGYDEGFAGRTRIQ